MSERDRFFHWLLTFLNIPYHWGGSNPLQGLDCSGLVQLLLGWFGLDPPGDQTANGLYLHFQKYGKTVDATDLGTLCFYGKPDDVTHVTMAIDGQRMIEAGGGGSKTITAQIAAQQGAYVKISRIARRADLVARIHPNGISF